MQPDDKLHGGAIGLYISDPVSGGVQPSRHVLHEVGLHTHYLCSPVWHIWVDAIIFSISALTFHPPLQAHYAVLLSSFAVTN